MMTTAHMDASGIDNFVVTLLGTGTPQPSIERFGPSVLVEAGDRMLLFDAGRGATIRLAQLGIPLSRITTLFLTHFHSDHTSGIPDLWLTGCLPPVWAARKAAFNVIGPIGTKTLMNKLAEAYAVDIAIRLADEKISADAIGYTFREFGRDGTVYDEDGVKVIAFEVDHGEDIKPAFGYRVEYRGRAAVISGDTRFHSSVVDYGMGADLLIHEVAAARPGLLVDPFMQRIFAHHTSPREAGRVFARAKPKLAAYTHFVLLGSPAVKPMTIDDVLTETRETYSGPLEAGEDLMSFEIGDTVRVRRWNDTMLS